MSGSNPTEPRIYLIARPALDLDAFFAFLSDRGLDWRPSDDAGDAEHTVEVCGRLCYLSFTDDTSRIRFPNAAYVRNLIDKGHESVLEHATWTFIIDRVSRAFTHQLVRHRIGFAYSQLSQQYHDEREAEFVEPAGLSGDAKATWKSAVAQSLDAYRRILAASADSADADGREMDAEHRRLVRSAARSVLPNATATAIAVTANARALRHFLSLRGATLGDVEMRLVSARLLEHLQSEAAALFADFHLETADDGWPLVTQRRDAA